MPIELRLNRLVYNMLYVYII
ncbi:hypothetical protein F383_11963 [Gossypium arboreum]|uniref:Uncharacterized protein n=1 Tax=Gossypium arboreum TaxID=29729 RepID=A0A0B0PZX9_GOSAR|nr:hypothetical protein F383_11963 [Gossypium arboreum]